MILTIGYTGLRWGEAIGLERGYLHPGEIHVEWQLREINGRFHRLPPKDDSYRSPAWEPCLPVDFPPFLAGLLARQIQDHPHPALRLRRPARRQRPVRVPRPGRRPLPAQQLRPPRVPPRLRRPLRSHSGRPRKLIIADATTWPGVPIAAWPPADPSRTTPRRAAGASRPSPTTHPWPAGSRSSRA